MLILNSFYAFVYVQAVKVHEMQCGHVWSIVIKKCKNFSTLPKSVHTHFWLCPRLGMFKSNVASSDYANRLVALCILSIKQMD